MSNFSNFLSFFNSITTSFPNPNFFLEQYSTSLDILEAYFDLYPSESDATILDLGIGTGILSFLASIKGAKRIIGIDIDRKVLQVARLNAQQLHLTHLNLIHSAVEFFNFTSFTNRVNGIIMNPPFGTKRKFLDFVFLKRAMQTKAWILTLHKSNNESDKKLLELCNTNNYMIGSKKNLTYNLPNTHKTHTLQWYPVKVTLYLLFPKM